MARPHNIGLCVLEDVSVGGGRKGCVYAAGACEYVGSPVEPGKKLRNEALPSMD